MSRHTPPRLITLTLLNAVSLLTLNAFLPALPHLAADFAVSEAVIAISISGYMVVAAIFQITLGPLSDRIGRRPVMVGAFATYIVASLGCFLATDVVIFLLFRLVQAVVVAGYVLSSAVIRDQFDAKTAAGKMGTIAASMALAPMLGPMVGGILDTAFGWRAIFVVYTALGALAFSAAWFDLGETRKPGASKIKLADYRALLRSGRYWAYVLCQSFAVGSFYIFLAGSPFVSAQVYGLSTAVIGITLGSITGGFMVGAAITSRLAPRLGIARLIIAGRTVPTIGLVTGLAAMLGGVTHPLALFLATLCVGVGNGLTLSNANAGALSVRPDLAGTAAGLSGALAIAGGAGLTAITALAMTWWVSPIGLALMMLTSVGISFAAGLIALRLERQAS